MKFTPTEPPREFEVGRGATITIKDCARIELEPDEQVTFVAQSGAEYDVARKSWGFYATPSINGRLREFGWRTALVKSRDARFYVFLVERDQERELRRYLETENHSVVCWLDEDDVRETLERKVRTE